MHATPVQIDTFADAPFEGNPAAVTPLRSWAPDRLLQHVALENDLSGTAFVVPAVPVSRGGTVHCPVDGGRPFLTGLCPRFLAGTLTPLA